MRRTENRRPRIGSGPIVINIGFALLSPSRSPIPSTRIACLNLFPYLRAAGYEPIILSDPAVPNEVPLVPGLVERALATRCSIVVFQKIHGPSVLEAVKRLKALGVRTLYCVCDLVNNDMAAEVDATVVVTDFLKSLYRPELQDRIFVVHDGVEQPGLYRSGNPPRYNKGRRLKAALVTSQELYCVPVVGVPPAPWSVDIIGYFPKPSSSFGALRRARWSAAWSEGLRRQLTILHALASRSVRHVPWHPHGVYERLLASDIGIIPVDTSAPLGAPGETPSWKVKSENRLTLKMALGLPVIATPIPAYESVIDHGHNGYLARSGSDWLACFRRLEDEDLRREMGAKARESVLNRFSIEAQAGKFLNALQAITTCDMA
jgi:glycosyltransferase involved in cell wall biosynthesis